MSQDRYAIIMRDLLEPTCWDESNKLVTFATEKEAAAEIADSMIEYWTQVKEGGRSLDEVPDPDFVVPCTVHDDGGISTEVGTWTPQDLAEMRGVY